MAKESMEKTIWHKPIREKNNLAEKNLPGLLTLCPLIVLIRFISDETTAIASKARAKRSSMGHQLTSNCLVSDAQGSSKSCYVKDRGACIVRLFENITRLLIRQKKSYLMFF